jgi:hypothetical protein
MAIYKRLLRGDYNTTLAYLEAMSFIPSEDIDETDPNIALGDTFLTSDAKTRAYWNFTTQLSGNESDAITSVSDLRGNGWTLGNFSGGAFPIIGKMQEGLRQVNVLNAYTPSGFEHGLVGTTAATNLLKNSVEVHLLLNVFDGQPASTIYLFGCGSGTLNFRIGVNTSGNITVDYSSFTTLSQLSSTGNSLINGLTGVRLIRVRLDFGTDTISGIVDGGFVTNPTGFLPFYIKEGFEGIIPQGTPIAQIVPFRQENWSSKIIKGLLSVGKKQGDQGKAVLTGWYKKTFWRRKNYN